MKLLCFVCLAILATVGADRSRSSPRYRRSIEEIKNLVQGLSQPNITSADTYFLSWNDCPKYSQYFNGSCYRWSGENDVANWFTSELKCSDDGSHLVSILTKEESQIVQGITLCSNHYWIGLVNTEYDNGEFLKATGWSWWDRSEHKYTRINIGNTAGANCVYAHANGNWYNSYCSHNKFSYVCKKSFNSLASETVADSMTPSPTKSPSLCPKNWVHYDNNCYYFSNTNANYFHAHLYCYDFKAHVVNIKSAHEQTFIQAANGCDNKFWIGLERAIPCVSDKTKNDCWEWSDLSPVIYQNWKNKKPTDGSNECAFSQGYWENSVPCQTQMRFVCKRAVE